VRQTVCKYNPLRNHLQNGDCSVGNYIYTQSAAQSAIKHVFRGAVPCYYGHPFAYRVESYCCSVCFVAVSCTHCRTFENILVPVPPGPRVIHLQNIIVPVVPLHPRVIHLNNIMVPVPPGLHVIHLKNILGPVPRARVSYI
jgi:hypothetical protein